MTWPVCRQAGRQAGRQAHAVPRTCSKSGFLSVTSSSPDASSSSRVFIASEAHCNRLSVSRPLYFERSSCVVPSLMIFSIPLLAAVSILYPLEVIFLLQIVTSSGTCQC